MRNLPMPEQVATPKLRKPIAEFQKWTAKLSAARAELVRLENTRRDAVAEDARALGEALRAGKPDPGDAVTRQHDERIAAVNREVRALQHAATTARAELVAAMEDSAERERDAAEQKIAKARQAVGALVEDLAFAHADLAEAEALARWARGTAERGAEGAKFVVGPGRVPALLGINGDPVLWTVVLDALRQVANPPAPVEQPRHQIDAWQNMGVPATISGASM